MIANKNVIDLYDSDTPNIKIFRSAALRFYLESDERLIDKDVLIGKKRAVYVQELMGQPPPNPKFSFLGLPTQYLKTESHVYKTTLEFIEKNHPELKSQWLDLGGWKSYGVRVDDYRNHLPIS